MGLLLILFLSALVAATTMGEVSQHIVGGVEANHGDHPYICSLQQKYSGWYHICGSAIWNNDFIVTAAHCVDPSGEYRVVCGIHKINQLEVGQARNVSQVIVHENYNRGVGTYPNDIAVLRLISPLTTTQYVQAFDFASPSDGDFAGQTCVITGWGRKADGSSAVTLKKVHMETISNNACKSDWGSRAINDGHVCILESGKSSCNGDSGGPHRCGNKIVGLTSWGVSSCSPSLASVNTRVSHFYHWLKAKTGTL